ncbi:MAG: alpha/beta hydrolase [Clostridiales bacterium]|nr:alpha/beta hydrolase [Clostridiales bacterium]
MFLDNILASHYRKKFIANCVNTDTERMKGDIYPDDVEVIKDVPYRADKAEQHLLDFYLPEGYSFEQDEKKTAFLLMHGGALVYGFKELDKAFGMKLAKVSGLPVINMNYTLLPGGDLKNLIGEIKSAIDFVAREKGIEKIHTIGDSSGGYLALLVAMIMRDAEIRKDLGISFEKDVECLSSNMVCGSTKVFRRTFPGIYFEGKKKELPDYIYDLTLLTERDTFPYCNFMSGDKDFLDKDNTLLSEKLRELGKPHYFELFKTTSEERQMYHVFSIAHPEWPESDKFIQTVAEYAKG